VNLFGEEDELRPTIVNSTDWPKDIVCWEEEGGGQQRKCMTVPFTWLLPKAQRYIDVFPGLWIVGGPAVALMPTYLHGCQIGYRYDGVLQRVNPQATRTTTGCPNRCAFCGVTKIEPAWAELDDWPDLPIVCDNNLLAASDSHIAMVCARLKRHGWCDFNQGLDASLLRPWHAKWIAEIGKPICRLALDSDECRDEWGEAVEMLRTAGVAKSRIKSYVLCGFAGSPEDDWRRCNFVESFGVKACPMWFHRLDCLKYNEITEHQEAMGWTRAKQRQLMAWHYKHFGKPLVAKTKKALQCLTRPVPRAAYPGPIQPKEIHNERTRTYSGPNW